MYEALLVRWNSRNVMNLGLHILNGVAWFHIQCDGLARKCLDEDLHFGLVRFGWLETDNECTMAGYAYNILFNN